jgi:hypothetical protein
VITGKGQNGSGTSNNFEEGEEQKEPGKYKSG